MTPGLIVGTAGHIDHGKTSLVRTLTGIDLDTLPEERDRGITIALGFTALDLADGRRAAFVDVPGHERLVRTMVAGASGIDAVLLCVSAVDGVMPQTREHLAILDLLGLHQGAIALTMADLVDEELLELAIEDVTEAVAGTFLEGAPVVPFSSLDGRGSDEVKSLLGAFSPPDRAEDGPFRLPVDRHFTRPGFGTVVTGTAWSGAVPDGAIVQLLPQGRTARIRGIEVHGHKAERATAGRRTALNLASIESDDTPRGTVIVLGDVPCPSMIDVRYTHLSTSAELADGASVRVLLGTAERVGKLHRVSAGEVTSPGETVWAQLRLNAPLPCLPGDRFIVRRESPIETLGGGQVVDPWAPRLRRKDRPRAADQLARLHGGEVRVWLERSGELGLTEAEWHARGGESSVGVVLAGRRFAETVVARLTGNLLEALTTYHDDNPLSLGAHRRELRRGRLAHLPDRVFDALVDTLADGSVHIEGPLVRVRGFEVTLSTTQQALADRIAATLTAAGLGGVASKALHTAHPEPETQALIHLLGTRGSAVEVAGVGWTDPGAIDTLRSALSAHFSEQDRLTPGDFKELTGLTRKAAIPLLEWLDKQRWTRRDGDARVVGGTLEA